MPPKNLTFRNCRLYQKIGPGHYRPVPKGIQMLLENCRYDLSAFYIS